MSGQSTGHTVPSSNVIQFPRTRSIATAKARHPAGRARVIGVRGVVSPFDHADQSQPQVLTPQSWDQRRCLLDLAGAVMTAHRELSCGITDGDGGASLTQVRGAYLVSMTLVLSGDGAHARAVQLERSLDAFEVRTAEHLVDLALAQLDPSRTPGSLA